MKLSLKVVLFLLLFVATERFCHKQTGGFQVYKILSAQQPPSTLPPLSSTEKGEVQTLLAQPFYFLGHGGQCYAFVSEDGKTVLKFFKQHHIRLFAWLSHLSLPTFLHGYRETILSKMAHQSTSLIESCKISYLEFKEQTGLIYLHLGKTEDFRAQVTLVDKLGIAHKIPLSEVDFALQYKAELTRPRLRKLLKEQDLDSAKQCIQSLLHLIAERAQKGIVDRDPNIRRNMGFVGNQAIEIDLGSYSKEDSLPLDPDLELKTAKLKRWLNRKSPELSQFLSDSTL